MVPNGTKIARDSTKIPELMYNLKVKIKSNIQNKLRLPWIPKAFTFFNYLFISKLLRLR